MSPFVHGADYYIWHLTLTTCIFWHLRGFVHRKALLKVLEPFDELFVFSVFGFILAKHFDLRIYGVHVGHVFRFRVDVQFGAVPKDCLHQSVG